MVYNVEWDSFRLDMTGSVRDIFICQHWCSSSELQVFLGGKGTTVFINHMSYHRKFYPRSLLHSSTGILRLKALSSDSSSRFIKVLSEPDPSNADSLTSTNVPDNL